MKTCSDEEIKNYNLELILESAGCIGGNYQEQDIKLQILRESKNYFPEQEYQIYENYILNWNKPKIKTKKTEI